MCTSIIKVATRSTSPGGCLRPFALGIFDTMNDHTDEVSAAAAVTEWIDAACRGGSARDHDAGTPTVAELLEEMDRLRIHRALVTSV